MCSRAVTDHHSHPARVQVELFAVAHRVAGCTEEVTNMSPPLELRVFVDDNTAPIEEVAEMAKKVMKKLKEEVEKKGLQLSVTENGKEGKSKMIASCGFLENELRQFSREEGVTLADCVEILAVDLRTIVKSLGAKEKARRKKCNVRFSLMKKNKAFHKHYVKVVVKKLLRAGMIPARTWRAHAVEMSPTERFNLRRQMAAAAGKVRPLCLCSWKHTAWKWKKSSPPWLLSTGKKECGQENGVTSKKEGWMRQIREVQTWKQVRGARRSSDV